ncbi:hypothetical protein [Ketogulonicigenium vulgare]|uniref:Uncharacterized protein n=1 Tax=Ketogulonicigenium vulgare (strain WSH-001) TaxID=759362 RepID=F9YA33_KETVW|nr:hypothetical protein [Ketogulonicigenium vulgare]ADO43146.1 hypothetical protein EIO_2038 [Ketogulonicigenium vulgare Y25]AEM41444.1 hypothetical protein KVU_1605 [Ketogulonicigenium vulgare WSH-001]ALJ81578.1 hypothetical protein KVH_10570 [Ketogulonicigenium vulgare]ANW35127.1 hypothetical protein KvSKV_10490 [Ketogulonicigenium vulgare]AOZ55183.1 hypothetical protein KVC_2176 [Ketogulonicigenium vulgare]
MTQTKPPASSRDARLKAALKSNIARRKAQMKARAASAEEDEAPEPTSEDQPDQ